MIYFFGYFKKNSISIYFLRILKKYIEIEFENIKIFKVLQKVSILKIQNSFYNFKFSKTN
jgi:hypothetical protein